jgi:hypothetical protein
MTPSTFPAAKPVAFTLKRHMLQHAHRFWCEIDARHVATAPIYLFPDSRRFDADDVQQLARANMAGTLKLPHAHCIFELQNPDFPGASVASYVRATEAGADSFLFRFDPKRKRWSDLLAAVEFQPDGYAEVIGHPEIQDPAEYGPTFESATGMVWRALGLLSTATPFTEHRLSPLRRTPLAKAGIRGWTYRVADIQTGVITAGLAEHRGTHASPRWHVRRGHWRQLADGRRIFVRECEVGDPSRGGVLKDYRLDVRDAA